MGLSRLARAFGPMFVLAATLSACAAGPAPTPQIIYVTPAPTPAPTQTPAPTPKPTPEPTPAPVSVVCDVFGAAREHFIEAFNAEILGENAGPDLLNAGSDIRGVIARADNASEKEDITTLAHAFGIAAVSGGGWVEADDAYEPFFVKYAEQCGLEIAE